MDHIYWTIDRILAGRPGPIMEPWDLDALKAGGITSIISLDSKGVNRDVILKHGFSHKFFLLPDSVPPEHTCGLICTRKLPVISKYLHCQIQKGDVVLVHCFGGRDRTCFVLAYYLCCLAELHPEEGLSKIREYRADALSAEGWEEMSLSVMNSLLFPINVPLKTTD